jgi:hypothetical protein
MNLYLGLIFDRNTALAPMSLATPSPSPAFMPYVIPMAMKALPC